MGKTYPSVNITEVSPFIVEVGAVHGHAKTADYQWPFSHWRRILRLRRIIHLQNPWIAHPIKTVPFSLSDTNYPTDNPS